MAELTFGLLVGYWIGSYFATGRTREEAMKLFMTYLKLNHPKTFTKVKKEFEEM